ncbi:MAG TPA: putative Ig domain-containing protein [Terriglobales bacterium]|nr:putative Ig domain-containing protein [Terriglobales bacterium]
MNLKLTGSAFLALLLLGTSISAAQQGGAIGEPIVLQTTSLPKAFLRQPYHFKLEAQGGILPLRWEVTAGAPAPGIDLSADGNLTGAPTEVDSFHFVVTITDSGKPTRSQKKEFTLDVVAPLLVEWSKKPKVNGRRVEGSIKVSNQTEQDFDFTFVALAVDATGRATAVGYQHFTLKKNTDEFEIPFGENLPFGAYDLNLDAVAEVAATNTIYRARLNTGEKLQVQQGP